MKKRLKNLMYGIPIALASLLPMKEAKGQDLVRPSGVINPFISPDTTEAAITYNNLNSKTRAERDGLADAIIKASRVHTIPENDDPVFNCNNWRNVQIMNSYDWGDNIYETYDADRLLFNGYKGFVLSEIYANGGTFADQGKDGLPLYGVTFKIPLLNAAHAMVTLLTGNNALNGADWNDIEPRDGVTNVKPGEINIPLDTDEFTVYLPYLFKNTLHEKNYMTFRVLEFEIINGEKILTYNVNDDSRYNTRMRLITQRESDPPVINIKQGTDLDSLVCNINDANLKSVWYTIDGGAKIPLMTEELAPVTEKKVAIKMNLPPGTHQIALVTDDYFRLKSEKTTLREIVNNTPPNITITSPTEGTTYDKDIQLIYNITDNDFATATYKINNGTKTTINQNGTIPLTLTDGLYKIVIEATDTKPQTTKDSVNFQIKANTPPIITITSPENGKTYDKDLQLIYNITDTDFATAWYAINNGTKINIAQNGTIPLTLTDGLYKIVIEATDTKPQTTKDSVNFQIKKTTDITPVPEQTKCKIYPNPTAGPLTMIYPNGDAMIEIYDITGKRLEQLIDNDQDGRTEINLTSYPAGMYIYRANIGDKKYNGKIIKK